MGLDTTHNCWHGPYSSFKQFREAVAEAALEHYGYTPNYDGHPHRAYQGWWDHPEMEKLDPRDVHHYWDDPLDVFFIHSDCDGYIFPQDAGPLSDRLDALVGYLDDGPFGWRPILVQFIAGLRIAEEFWEVVSFR